MMWRDAYQSGRGAGEPRGVARLVGESPPMRELKEKIPRVAGAPSRWSSRASRAPARS